MLLHIAYLYYKTRSAPAMYLYLAGVPYSGQDKSRRSKLKDGLLWFFFHRQRLRRALEWIGKPSCPELGASANKAN